MNHAHRILAVSIVGLLAACAVPSAEEAPDAEEATVAETAIITTTDGWTADAQQPVVSGPLGNYVKGSAIFSGPGGTKKMGVCLLKMTSTPCSGTDSLDAQGYAGPCVAAVGTVPTGGHRYCTDPDGGSTQKYCAFRPGSNAAYCAGSPANGGVAVGAGTYTTPQISAASTAQWVSYACFNGCAGTTADPSVSSIALSMVNCGASCPGYTGCVDIGCDGAVNYCYLGGRMVRPTSC